SGQEMNLQRGDIVLVNFDPVLKSEATATQPAILITNDKANELSPTLVVVPVTNNVTRLYPFEVLLERSRSGLEYDSKVQVQYIRHVSRERLGRSLSHTPKDVMKEIDERIREHLAL
ncbi:MAG: type II toxin-antitoxin system PemK/MazF family toxin, partial [Trueperaceae bacterium]